MSIKAQAEDVVEGCRALQCIPLKPDPSHGPSEVSWARTVTRVSHSLTIPR